jgi:hypothetical protein
VGVHVGLPAVDGVGGCCGRLLSASPPVREVWDWNAGNPGAYPCPGSSCIYKGIYFPADRQADTRYNAGTQPLSWFYANHPDWVQFRCSASGVSEATAFSSPGRYVAFYPNDGASGYTIPLDTANPAVLAWEETKTWGPALATGHYQHVDFDNFVAENGAFLGQPCGHYDTSGHWVPQYNGTLNDAHWRAHEIALAAALQTWVHTHYPNVAVAGNLSWFDGYLTDQLSLLSHLDLWFDEQGFTNGNSGGANFLDTAWADHAAAVQAVLTAGHGWQDINQEPVNFANTTRAQRQWALGNYLLLKNNASWLYITGHQQYGTLLIAPEYAAHIGTPTNTYYPNQGIYRRDYTNGLVLVNPSSTTPHTITIPPNTYKDLYGNPQPAIITLAPASAQILLREGD